MRLERLFETLKFDLNPHHSVSCVGDILLQRPEGTKEDDRNLGVAPISRNLPLTKASLAHRSLLAPNGLRNAEPMVSKFAPGAPASVVAFPIAGSVMVPSGRAGADARRMSTCEMRRNPLPWRTEHATGRSAPRSDGTFTREPYERRLLHLPLTSSEQAFAFPYAITVEASRSAESPAEWNSSFAAYVALRTGPVKVVRTYY